MQPLIMIEQKFTDAGLSWDLDRLYTDLAEMKQACNRPNKPVILNEVEAACLRGLLCGHSPSEIAIELNRDVTGLRVDLSRGLYAYIEILTDQRPKNWRQIAFLLEKAGYRLGLANGPAAQQRATTIRQDLGLVVDVLGFCGRATELETLKQGLDDRDCRVITLTGMGGIGKTAVAATLIQRELAGSSRFAGVIWRSLRYAPPVAELLAELRQFVDPQEADRSDRSDQSAVKSLDQEIAALLAQLRSQAYLIVLDDWETVLQEGQWAGYCAPAHSGYGRLLQRLMTEPHQSCLLLISREQPIEVATFTGATTRSLKLKGLPLSEARDLLRQRGLVTDETGLPELVQVHRGNPAALLRAAQMIQDLLDGDIPQFLAQTSLVLGDVLADLLDQQFTRLSDPELAILFRLSGAGQPLAIEALKSSLETGARSQLLTALDSLRRRSLVEKVRVPGQPVQFTLEPTVMKYGVQRLIDRLSQDVNAVVQTRSVAQLGLLRHRLVDQSAPAAVQAYQQRLVQRLGDRLSQDLGGDWIQLVTQLVELRDWLRQADSIGAAEVNVAELLQRVQGSLED